MAADGQTVTLGKGEVDSSILSGGTTFQALRAVPKTNSLHCLVFRLGRDGRAVAR
jgi:hypothetical protein